MRAAGPRPSGLPSRGLGAAESIHDRAPEPGLGDRLGHDEVQTFRVERPKPREQPLRSLLELAPGSEDEAGLVIPLGLGVESQPADARPFREAGGTASAITSRAHGA